MTRFLTYLFSVCTLMCVSQVQASDSEPVLRYGIFPIYPECGIVARIQGYVRIRAALNSDGEVVRAFPIGRENEELIVTGNYKCLCQTAQKAVSLWRFEKGHDGREVVLSFHFELLDYVSEPPDLYPVYIPPSVVRVRGYAPSIAVPTR